MDILLSLFSLCGGLAFFLYGMDVMSNGLKKLAGGNLERSLKKVTANTLAAMGLGTVITAAIQSSSAVTVMLVGLVNSGIMPFEQTIGVILGSNIGTTATNWLAAMSGVDGQGFLVLLKPSSFTPILAVIGVIMIMMSKKNRRQDIGKILVGFAVLMFGMTLMGDSVSALEDSPQFQQMLLMFSNPILGLLVSMLFTGIIQSSSAAVSIIQSLSVSGGLTFGTVIPLILGANIGTCITAVISSIGVTKDAKKVSVIHIVMKVIGAVVCMGVFYGLNAIIGFSFIDQPVNMVWIAIIHTAFNVSNTIMLLPFHNLMVKIANRLVKSGKEEQSFAFLDERLLDNVSVAVNEAQVMTLKMAELAENTVLGALDLCKNYDAQKAEKLLSGENDLDMYEDKLGTFLVQLSTRSLSEADSHRVTKMLHAIGDFERLGDHASNLVDSAREISDKKIVFSAGAQEELDVLHNALREIMTLSVQSYCSGDVEAARKVEPLEEVIDRLVDAIHSAHIERLQSGTCTIQTGFVLSDLLNNYERISDHCSNIALAVVETSMNSFEAHGYTLDLKDQDANFAKMYKSYKQKYHL